MVIVLMGVTGSGKTTVGTLLAARLRCDFLDADSLHSPAHIAQMHRGIPLTDDARASWLRDVHARMMDADDHHRNLVVACSALKAAYRATLSDGLRVIWVYLAGSEDLIRSRLQTRTDHFADSTLLPSQFDTLEEPSNAIAIDIAAPPAAIVDRIIAALRPSAGLCDSCTHAKTITSSKGSTFIQCLLSFTDPRFPRYPPLPVVRCGGYSSG